MKKLLLLLFIPLMIACSSDNDDKGDEPEKQGYTSIVVNNDTGVDLYYVVTGWKDKDGVYHRIADHGHLKSKQKAKEFVMSEHHTPIYIFCTLYKDGRGIVRLDSDYIVKENIKNNIVIIKGTPDSGDKVDKDDSKTYPVK